jgi:hypothetical protein
LIIAARLLCCVHITDHIQRLLIPALSISACLLYSVAS